MRRNPNLVYFLKSMGYSYNRLAWSMTGEVYVVQDFELTEKRFDRESVVSFWGRTNLSKHVMLQDCLATSLKL